MMLPDFSEVKNWTKTHLLAAVRWLVWTPWRLIAAIVIVIVALVAYVQLTAEPAQNNTTATASPDPWQTWPQATAHPDGQTPTPTPSASAGHDHEAGDHHDPDPADAAKIKTTSENLAREFATAFLDTEDTKRDAWQKRLQPLVAPGLATDLETVDPANVPAGKVTEVAATYVGEFRAVVTVASSAGPMAIEVNFDGTQWLVTRYTPPSN